ncbi:MAG: hypothetical protein ABI681_04875 [Gemmatimonadales bacterium]
MHPALVTVGATNPQPLSLGPDHFGAMSVKDLRLLRGGGTRLLQNWSEGRAGADVTRTQWSGQSIRGISRGGVGVGSAGFPSAHARHFISPRKLQMTQMNVPQSEHG